MRERGALQLVDMVVGLFTLVALIALAPYFFEFASFASASADPFSSLLLRLAPPLMFVALLISLGVSARS